jgi:hypothetical protein
MRLLRSIQPGSTRSAKNDTNRFPYDLTRHEAPDGKNRRGFFYAKRREIEDYDTLLLWKSCSPQQTRAHANFLFRYARYLGMVQGEASLTNSMTVNSGGARNRMGGPQVPVPRLT